MAQKLIPFWIIDRLSNFQRHDKPLLQNEESLGMDTRHLRIYA